MAVRAEDARHAYLDDEWLGCFDTLDEAKAAAAEDFRVSAAYLVKACFAPDDQPTPISSTTKK
jgi:hypothetical protein